MRTAVNHGREWFDAGGQDAYDADADERRSEERRLKYPHLYRNKHAEPDDEDPPEQE